MDTAWGNEVTYPQRSSTSAGMSAGYASSRAPNRSRASVPSRASSARANASGGPASAT